MIRTAVCAFVLASVAAAQTPEAAPGRLAERLAGSYAGTEQATYGASLAQIDFRAEHGGTWLHARYRSTFQGAPVHSFRMMYRSYPDGEVRAWYFNDKGGSSEYQGRFDAAGMVLRNFDTEGRLLALQRYLWTADGYDFALSTPRSDRGGLDLFLEAHYARTARAGAFGPDPAALDVAQALPYSVYLGEFAGKEKSADGESQGRIRTTAILDGGWFLSEYASSTAGSVVYSGTGITRCDDQGRTLLYWFDSLGRFERLAGSMDAKGHLALRLDGAGKVLERHHDAFVPGGYDFRIEVADGSGGWTEGMTAEFRRVAERQDR
ncbi:MAG TPA: hypothetical protein VGC54_04800 [Planctomycetota bacterium]